MFSVGIFSTHIPYIAFVAFYAYFLLFGINQSSSGKFQTADKVLKIEFQSEKYYASSSSNLSYFDTAEVAVLRKMAFDEMLFKRKRTVFAVSDSKSQQNNYWATHFCRPPPVV
jgi:hypothetical protein